MECEIKKGEMKKEDKILQMIFASSCIETAARQLGCSTTAMYQRMKRVNLIEGYILKHYNAIHSESRKNITNDVIECLTEWEKRKERTA